MEISYILTILFAFSPLITLSIASLIFGLMNHSTGRQLFFKFLIFTIIASLTASILQSIILAYISSTVSYGQSNYLYYLLDFKTNLKFVLIYGLIGFIIMYFGVLLKYIGSRILRPKK